MPTPLNVTHKKQSNWPGRRQNYNLNRPTTGITSVLRSIETENGRLPSMHSKKQKTC
jgi:hypothetical protein